MEVVRLNTGGWARLVVNAIMRRVSPLHFKYYFSSGTPISGRGAPVLRTSSVEAGAEVDAEVMAVEVLEGPPEPQPPGMVGYPMPHFATSMEAIANLYEEIKSHNLH